MHNLLRAVFLLASLLLLTPTNAEEAYWEYTFRPGDSIWNIAKQYTTSVNNWQAIQKLNSVDKDRRIRPGTRLRIPVSMLKIQPAYAIIIATAGEVTVTDKSGNSQPATTDIRLYSGDEIATASNSNATIRFADGSELLILANSDAKMDTLSAHGSTGMVDTRVRLKSGQLDTRVNKQNKDSRYEIITPAAVAAVRGTAFRITASGSVMRNEVTDGVVAVASEVDEKSLDAGYGLVAEKDKPLPEPVKLLDAPEMSEVFYITNYLQAISWPPLAGAQAYRIQLAETDAFNKLIFDRVRNDSSTTIESLNNKIYSLRVRGIDGQQLQGLNAIARLDVSIIPAAPTLNAISNDRSINFNWDKSDYIAETLIEIARDAAFTDIVDTVRTSNNSYQTSQLDEADYYYRSKAVDKRGIESEFGQASSINTADKNNWLYVIGTGVIILLL